MALCLHHKGRRMRPIRSFDPETLRVLRQALEEAAEALPESERTQEQKVLLASRILSLAGNGGRDPVRLRTGALLRLMPSDP